MYLCLVKLKFQLMIFGTSVVRHLYHYNFNVMKKPVILISFLIPLSVKLSFARMVIEETWADRGVTLKDFTSSFYRRSKKVNNALRRWYWAIVMLNKSLRVVHFPFRRRGLLKVSNAQKTTHMIFWEIDLVLDGKFLTLLYVWVRLWCQIQSNSYFLSHLVYKN